LKPTEPNFQSVVDLGLRDVGMRNDPRRLAAHFGKSFAAVSVLVVLAVVAVCAVVIQTGAEAWMGAVFLLAFTAGLCLLLVRTVKRAPPMVVRVNAEGTNHATWMVIAPFLLLALHAALVMDLRLMPLIVLPVIMAVLVWRARRRVPDLLARLRASLASDEPVLGDGIGVARGAGRRRAAFRLVVVTDRRLLVATSDRSAERFLLVDAPHRDVSRFGIEWKYGGRTGTLSLTVPRLDGGPADTHVIASIVPANLLSIARALQSHGVQPDDPAAVSQAERAWEEAQREDPPRQRLRDRAAMSTRAFDRGLWLLLGLSAVNFYLHPFGVGLGMALVAATACVAAGYASGTRSSLAYIAPLNLLVVPAFFFAAAGEVILVMLMLTAVAAIGLWTGSALRDATAAPADLPSSARRAARGGLRDAISGLSLVRISAVLLATAVFLVAITTAAGFELTSLRPGADEATAKELPADGRSNLTGNAASLTYTSGRNLREFVTDEHWDGGPNDGARWELRSSFSGGNDVVSLAHYIFEPHLDDAAAVADFVAGKDDEHSRIAGSRVSHTERVVDGRTGYVWKHAGHGGYWHYVVWFPHPVHSVRVECVAARRTDRFERLCAEALSSLEFH
jgi:hypothetical protein